MSNEQYQALFGLDGPKLREMFLDGAPAEVGEAVAGLPDDELAELVKDLGGHDMVAMLEAYAQCDAVTDRPSVVFAYTVKGYGLPIAGNPRNHSALLSADQIGALRDALGLTDDWARFEPASPEGILCNRRREELRRAPGHEVARRRGARLHRRTHVAAGVHAGRLRQDPRRPVA